jgi:uncharacterized protein (DUF1015 family)
MADVVSPPYDVIDPRRHAELEAASPYNVVRLILPEAGGEDEVAERLERWQAEGVLRTDAEPAFYWVEQEYTGPDGVTRRRDGFIGLVRVEPYEARVVRPHERTHAAPKEGRLGSCGPPRPSSRRCSPSTVTPRRGGDGLRDARTDVPTST